MSHPLFTPVKVAHGWYFQQVTGVEPPNVDGMISHGQPYAWANGIGFVTAKDAETALLILQLLNSGLIWGTYKRSNKDINAERKELERLNQ